MISSRFSSSEEGAAYAAAQSEITAFVRHWDSLRRERLAPAWSEFDLPDVDPKLIPNVVVADVERDPLDFIIRFWGTAHVQRKGADKTGERVGAPPDLRGAAAFDEYRTVVETKAPVYSSSNVDLRGTTGVMPFFQVLVRLPLSNDGEDIHHVISLALWEAI